MKEPEKKLLLLELNEINFDIVKSYLQKYNFKSLRRICEENLITTRSEKEYSKLEPWIQWVSAHTGLEADEHSVYRLGDIINNNKLDQIFEVVENKGFRVGAVSPMNAVNKLKDPKYFIPDPWTETKSDNSFWSKKLSTTIKQAVNDNAKNKITLISYLILFLAILRFAKFKNYFTYFKLAILSFSRPWNKSLFLDLFLSDIHYSFVKKHNPNFSTLFLNAGAHIQHHFFLMSHLILSKKKVSNKVKLDPIKEMFKIYDRIIADYLTFQGYELIIATGLSQTPYSKPTYYYRPKDHASFLKKLNIKYLSVYPRMTRDFLIELNSELEAAETERKLISTKVISNDDNGNDLFSVDNRGKSLFVSLIYDKKIEKDDQVILECKNKIPLYSLVSFVAIKNGEHCEKGYCFYSKGIKKFQPLENSHVKNIFFSIENYFNT